MAEREPRGKVIAIKDSPLRRHARHFVRPVQSSPQLNAEQVIAETTIKKPLSPDLKIVHAEISPKEDIFISSHMK